MLTYIKINGFKSFQNFEMTFTPLTIIAGTNAAGKSNFSWPLRAAAAEANSPSLGKGWPKAGVGAATEAVRPLSVTRNAAAYITTPPYGHPF